MIPIIGFEGYFITKEGKVYCNLGKGNRDRSKRVELYEIKGRPTKKGYLRVYMRDLNDGKRKDKYIHRLVAEHFIPRIEQKNIVNHIDSIRSNNNVNNLEWVTQKENIDHAIMYGNLDRCESNGRMIRKVNI